MILSLLLTVVVSFLLLYGRIPTYLLVPLLLLICIVGIVIKKHHKHTHGSFLFIDVYAQRSKLNPWNAGLKFFFALACALICTAAQSVIVALFIFIGMSILTVFVGKTKPHVYFSLLILPASFIILSGLALLIEITPQPLGLLDMKIGQGYLSVTQSGQIAAFNIMIKAMGAVSCLYMLSLSTPIYHIINVLRKCKIPSVVIELMYLIYRYLFILLESHEHMVNAAAARLGYAKYSTALKTTLNGSMNLLFLSLRNASDMFSAMESRCYDGQIRFLIKPQKIKRKEVCIVSAFMLLVLILWAL